MKLYEKEKIKKNLVEKKEDKEEKKTYKKKGYNEFY